MTLPEPFFLDTNPATTQASTDEIIRLMLDLSVLYRGTPEYLWSQIIGYLRSLVRLEIDDAAKQTLVNFASASNLDQIGAFLDVVRLPEARATANFQANLSAVRAVDTFIPAGTRVRSDDGNFVFELSAVTIPAGSLTHGLPMVGTSQIAGEAPNGYVAGSITSIVDPVPFVTSIENITISSGGAQVETDERFRTRIKLAPGKLSVAGPVAAYQFWSLSASQEIVTVAVDSNEDAVANRDLVNNLAVTYFALFKNILNSVNTIADDTLLGENIRAQVTALGGYEIVNDEVLQWESYHTAPQYGAVNIFPLTENGLPSEGIKSAIKDILEPVRPFTDDVQVRTPLVVNFAIEVEFKTLISRARDVAEITAQVESAIVEYLKRIGAKLPTAYAYPNPRHYQLGIDVVRSQIVEAVQSVGGVYTVTILQPVEDIIIRKRDWTNCDSITFTWTGQEEG